MNTHISILYFSNEGVDAYDIGSSLIFLEESRLETGCHFSFLFENSVH
jgi:hypothetical protein